MSRLDAPLESGRDSAVSGNTNTRLSGSWLVIARVVWLVLAVPSLGLFVAGIPAFYKQLQMPCSDPVTCNIAGTLSAKGLQELPALGFSVSGYATFNTIFWVIFVAIWSGIGIIIFWRRSDDWLALLAAFFLVMFATTFPGLPPTALALAYPILNLPIMLMSVLGQISIEAFFVLFPNGRFVPRWIGLILLLRIIQAGSLVLPLTSPFNENNWPGWLNGLVAVVWYGAIIFSQIYRYRRVSSTVERQQTKWVVFGIITVVTGFIVFAPLFNGPLAALNQANTPSSIFLGFAYPFLTLLLPLSIGMAILRYRLYDIDILINRTLVYGAVTVSLGLVYFGLVIGLQSLVRLVTGQVEQSPVIIVASTLAIAALFQPLHRRIQAIIDRRFYRRKYDAAKTLEAFSTTLRGEVDLSQLSKHLVKIVEETMQPRFVWLWLRPMGQEEGKRKEWGRDGGALERRDE